MTTDYAYDTASRLTGLTYKLGMTTLGTLSYGYDAAGRRIVLGGTWARTLVPSALASATYNAANQQTAFGGQTLTYDLNGNLTSDVANTYTWSARNQLTAISGPLPASFVYDPLGRRQRKTLVATNTDFIYDGLNPVRQTVGATTVDLLTGLGIDEYLTRTTPTTAEHFLTDALGSTVALTDAGGAVRTEYTYAPFGVATMTGGSTNELGYAGREDDGTGLVYYRARYYDPTRQRFISEDPIGFNGGDPNLYAYVLNTPINYTDPSGEIAPIIAAGVACGAGAVGGIAVVLSGRKPTWNQLAAGAGIGCAGGLAVLGVWTVAEGAAASAAVWPVMPEAIDKLEALAGKFATTGDKILSAAAQSNARFVDVLAKNFGNINIFLPRPDGAAGFMRVTLDPTQSRVISAG